MSTGTSLFGALLRAVGAFFKDDVVIQRGEEGMRVALRDRRRPAAPPRPSRAKLAAEKEQRELEAARRELAELLDADRALRSTLRHLAFVEQALEKKGWRGLYKVPLDVLQAALRQFESLVTNWSPAGLACLRSKMAVAVIDRETNDDGEADNPRTAALLENPPVLAARAIEAAKASAAAEADAEAEPADDAAALLAAYAGLVIETPAEVELQGELGSPSAKALARNAPH